MPSTSTNVTARHTTRLVQFSLVSARHIDPTHARAPSRTLVSSLLVPQQVSFRALSGLFSCSSRSDVLHQQQPPLCHIIIHTMSHHHHTYQQQPPGPAQPTSPRARALQCLRSLQNVFSVECVLYRMCSLQNVFSIECVAHAHYGPSAPTICAILCRPQGLISQFSDIGRSRVFSLGSLDLDYTVQDWGDTDAPVQLGCLVWAVQILNTQCRAGATLTHQFSQGVQFGQFRS